MITKIIRFDINKNLYDTLTAKQGDTKSRFLLFQLLDGAIPFSLENRSVRVYAIKADGTEVFNDLIVNDRLNGYCTLELTTQMLAVAGTVKLELMVVEEDKKLTSSIFELKVEKSINSGKAIVSTNEFNALLNALASLNEYDKYKSEVINLKSEVEEKADKNILPLNIKYFGAVGDGITDDTEAFKKAIKNISTGPVAENNYFSLYFPAGIYMISDTVDIVENTLYYGDGRSTVIKKKDKNLNKPLFRLKEKDIVIPSDINLGAILGSKEAEKYLNVNVTLRSLTFEGCKDFEELETINGADGLLLSGFFKLNLDDVHVKNFKGTGINFHTNRLSNTLRMINTFILQNNEFGVYTTGSCGDFHILLCDIGSSRLANVNFEATGSTIKDSVIWNSIEDCGIVTGNDLVNITNCNIEGNARHQILVWNNSHVMISGNRIYAGRYSGTAGIYCDNSIKEQENIVITNNNIISAIVEGWPTFAKAVVIGENHKNFTFKGNSIKYLGNGVEDKSKRPYVEGLSITKGDVWDELGELHYIKSGFKRTTLTPGKYEVIEILNTGYDLSDLIVDGKILIREDGIYTLSGSILIGYGQGDNPIRVNIVIKKANGDIEKQAILYTNTGEVSKLKNFSLNLLVERGDTLYLEGTSTNKAEVVEENVELSYIVLNRN